MIKNCLICNGEFRGFKSDEKYNHGKYCSRKCFFISLRKKYPNGIVFGKTWKHTEEYKKKLSLARTGEKNPMYVNGLGKTRKGKRFIKQWRDSVFKRDNYTCVDCGIKNGLGKTIILNAHHIIPWCIDKNNRFNVDNGITLCVDCHRKRHKKSNH